LYKGKKLKQAERPKTFIPGDQLEKLASAAAVQQNNGFNTTNIQQQYHQQHIQRVQPTKEDIEAIRVCPIITIIYY
jgi:hypothetical protein